MTEQDNADATPARMRVVTRPLLPRHAQMVYDALAKGPTVREEGLEIEEAGDER